MALSIIQHTILSNYSQRRNISGVYGAVSNTSHSNMPYDSIPLTHTNLLCWQTLLLDNNTALMARSHYLNQ